MATIQGLLASLLNPNPGDGGLLSNAGYLQSTGLGPQQMARYRQQSGVGGGQLPSSAPPGTIMRGPDGKNYQYAQTNGMAGASGPNGWIETSMQPQAPAQPDMTQTASTAPSGGGIGDFLGNLFAPKTAQRNKTVQLLMREGLDEGSATFLAGNKTAFTQYMMQRMQPQKRDTVVVDGKLVDAQSGQVIGDYGSGDNEYLERQGAATAFGLQPGTPEYQRFILTGSMPDVRDQDPILKSEMELRKEYDTLPEVKDYKIVKNNFERIRQGVQLGTGAGDAAIVFGYMKMLDPTSVVREGEQATTRNAAGVPEAVRGLYNQIVGGGQLSAEARNQILGAAEKVYGESSANIEDLNKRYSTLAEPYGIDPGRVISPIEQYDPLQILPPPNAVPPTGRDRFGSNPATGKGDRLRSDPLGIR